MNIKELIAKNLPAIKKLVFEEEQQMESNEAKLSDGLTVIKWDGELAAGTAILVVSEEGLTPAPDGSHELENGTKIEVKDGLVESVETKEEEKEEENKEEVVEVEMVSMETFNSLVEKVFKLETERESFATNETKANQELTAKITKLEEALQLMFQVVEVLSNEPQKIEEIKPDNKQEKKDNFYNALEEISKKLNK